MIMEGSMLDTGTTRASLELQQLVYYLPGTGRYRLELRVGYIPKL
jgi:hypothetical protein